MIGTQKDYADHIGKSKQYVNKLVRQGRIPVRSDGKVDFAEADHALRRTADPARAMAEDEPDNDAPASEASEPTPQPAPAGGVSYSNARTAREAYAAKLAKLEYEQRIGQVVSRREVEDAMVAAGRAIRSGLDAIPGLADEVVAVCSQGGGSLEVRQLLRGRVRELEQVIADSLTRMGRDDGQDTE